ncbi:MAG TPA: alpha/beta hydrolase [Pyrinomonadaceae bacterium]|jgi:proline iminopeptidase|nr:alpha/beta hydrolase [Pyrinomonadaceae bacterium]
MFRLRRGLYISTLYLLLLLMHSSTSYGRILITNGKESQQKARNTRTVRVEEGYVTTDDGVRLFYQRAGRGGRTIIIPGRLFVFDDLKQLADRYTVISYDMRNRGRSSAVSDGSRITIQDDIKDLEKVRQHFRVKKFVAVGYSYLGMMVVLYTMEHPQFVEKIVQFGPVPLKFGTRYPAHLTTGDEGTGADPAEIEKVRRLEEQGYAKTNPKEFCEAQWAVDRYGLVGNPANVWKLGKGWCEMPNEWPVNFERHIQYHFASVQKLNVSWEKVAKVTQPVLTVHGTKDRNAPYGAGREWALRLPNARLLTIRDAAHQSFAEYPEIIINALRAFLGGRWPDGAEKVTEIDNQKISK